MAKYAENSPEIIGRLEKIVKTNKEKIDKKWH